MTDLKKHSQRTAAARAGFSERSARRFNLDPTPPSQRKIHHGRTVADPLEGFWENDLLPLLEKDSALQAVTLLRHLQSEHPVVFPDDRIRRTLERRVRQWRALNGPERDIIFRQTPEPGYMAQSDFTNADELQITIAGLLLAAAIFGFLVLNYPFGLIFLGDAGAYTIGFILSWFGISILLQATNASPWAILLTVFWPLADTLLAIYRRLNTSTNAFAPDRLHVHQMVLRSLEIYFLGRHQRKISNPLTTLVLAPFVVAPPLSAIFLSDISQVACRLR